MGKADGLSVRIFASFPPKTTTVTSQTMMTVTSPRMTTMTSAMMTSPGSWRCSPVQVRDAALLTKNVVLPNATHFMSQAKTVLQIYFFKLNNSLLHLILPQPISRTKLFSTLKSYFDEFLKLTLHSGEMAKNIKSTLVFFYFHIKSNIYFSYALSVGQHCKRYMDGNFPVPFLQSIYCKIRWLLEIYWKIPVKLKI